MKNNVYPVPKNHKELQSLIGLASYFRRFVPNFSIIAKLLYNLPKKGIMFEFGEEQLKSLDSIKEKLGSQPLLAIYDSKASTELHCDVSSHGYGAILLQKQADNIKNITPYFIIVVELQKLSLVIIDMSLKC